MFGVSEIPAAGKVLEVFVELFWPEGDKPDPWEQIKERAEALIESKLSDDARSRMKAALDGLRTNLQRYNQEIQGDGSAEHKFSAYEALRFGFDQQLPAFKQENQKAVLLPLFVQAANLHLSFLRDAHNNGSKLGFSSGEAAGIKQSLKDTVASHTKYVKDTFMEKYVLYKGIPFDKPGTTEFERNMTLDVGDYLILWQYFDPDHSPPDKMPLTREIYSDALGNMYGKDPQGGIPQPPGGYYPPPPSNEKITKIRVRAAANLDSIQVWYGNSPTPIMGGPGHRGTMDFEFTLSEEKLEKLTHVGAEAWGTSGPCVRGLYLGFSDGTEWNVGQGPTYKLPVPADHYLSSINVISKYLDTDRGWLHDDLVRMLWFGFKMKPNTFLDIPAHPQLRDLG
jgi:hypothetical protein